jgi:2-dehydropantoate 2-reductase
VTSIAIIGPGAIGATVAAWLARSAAHEVTLCVRTPVDELVVETPGGTVRAAPQILTDPAQAQPVDWVLVATKVYDAAAAARWLAPLTGAETRVAILQNGVEHRTNFAGLVADERLVPVSVDIPAERSAPGRVRQHRYGTLTVADDDAGRAFVALFTGTPIEAQTTPDFTTVVWRKLAINASGIALTLIDKPFGATHDEGVAEVIRTLVAECRAVGLAEGADLPETLPDEIVAYYRAQAPTLKNSLHSDLLAGRPLELDARNGVIVRLGEKHNVPTPAMRMMVALVRAAVG